jgi:hypothetical protein
MQQHVKNISSQYNTLKYRIFKLWRWEHDSEKLADSTVWDINEDRVHIIKPKSIGIFLGVEVWTEQPVIRLEID